MWFRKKKKKDDEAKFKDVRLVVTGNCGADCHKKLREDLKKKGVKAVVTSSPVLGVFDL